MYHNITVADGKLHLYDVSPENFKKQIEILRNTACSAEVILTFDDGFKSWANEVLDILKSANLMGYFFVCIKNIKNKDITETDIRKLHDSGMIIGSHSMTHNYMHRLSDEEIYYELKESKNILEGIVGEDIESFSVPRGLYKENLLRIAKEIGYKNVFTSDYGINNGLGFTVKRIPVKRGATLKDFQCIITAKQDSKGVFYQKVKDAAKSILGIDNYDYVRRILVPRAERQR